MRIRRSRRVTRMLGVATLIFGAGAAAVTAGTMPAQAEAMAVKSASSLASARTTAAAQGSRVEVTSLEDEYSDTYVNPDGTLTTESSPTPVHVEQDGAWVPVDFSLRHIAGGWSPAASPVDVAFSDGGEKDAVTFGDGSRTLDLSWDVTLPQPSVSGATATYDLGDGESLVLTAVPNGFEQSLVLDAPPTTLPQIRLPFDTSGLTMSANGAGGFDFVDARGKAVYTMPQPVMYGAAIDSATEEPAQSHPVAADLVQTAAGPRLDLSPSLQWLTDPTTTYPVTIDPAVVALTPGKDTFVQDNLTSAQDQNWYLHAGMYNGQPARAYIRWDLSSTVHGKDVESATLQLRDYHSNDCTPGTLNVYPLAENFATDATWANKPARDTDPDYSASATFASGANATCPDSYQSIDVTNMVSAWALGVIDNYGLELSGSETSGAQGWGFCSADWDPNAVVCNSSAAVEPTLTVTYDVLPPDPPVVESDNYPEGVVTPSSSAPLDLTLSDEGQAQSAASFSYSVDGGPYVTTASGVASVPAPTSAGQHEVDAYLTNASGSVSATTRYIFYVGSAPDPGATQEISGALDDNVVNGPTDPVKDALLTDPSVQNSAADGTDSRKPTWTVVPVTGQMQQQTEWCGPAAVRAALSSFGKLPSQKTLATQLNTNDKTGTEVSNLPAVLLKHESHNNYSVIQVQNWTDFIAHVVTDLGTKYRAPLIPLIKGADLPLWKANGYYGSHFIVINGYKSDKVHLKYFDPADADVLYGKHVVDGRAIYQALIDRGNHLVY